jgi:peptidylprolyl isomerase
MRNFAFLAVLAVFVFAALVVACSSPPGREPEAVPVASTGGTGGDEASNAPVDVACAEVSADPGYTCADDPTMRGRAGGVCPSGAPMVETAGVYAFPEAPVDAADMPSGVHVTESGLGTCVVRAGTGSAHPQTTDYVVVHYLGWNSADGVFDASVLRQTSARFRLDQVIAGWTEGVQLMVAGEVRRFFIPEYLAYQGQPARPAGMLLFDVELLDVSATE